MFSSDNNYQFIEERKNGIDFGCFLTLPYPHRFFNYLSLLSQRPGAMILNRFGQKCKDDFELMVDVCVKITTQMKQMR